MSSVVCPQSIEPMKSYAAKWLLFLDFDTDLKAIFGDMYVPMNSEVYVAQDEEGVVNLLEVYQVGPGQALITRGCGQWTPQEGLKWARGSYWRRGDLQGLPITAAYINVTMSHF